jgi:hypothetical protein
MARSFNDTKEREMTATDSERRHYAAERVKDCVENLNRAIRDLADLGVYLELGPVDVRRMEDTVNVQMVTITRCEHVVRTDYMAPARAEGED